MRKLGTRCVLLCAALLLLCGTALAAGGTVGDVKETTDNVKVEKATAGNDTTFNISRTDAEKDQLYLVLLQKGDAEAPTENDIYYINVVAATDTGLSATAYPKDMTDGDYHLYLSDYTGGNAGKRAEVANFVVGGGTDEYTLGDVNHDGNIDATDAMNVMQMFAGLSNGDAAWTDAQKQAANVNGDDSTDATDAMWIMQHFAGLMDDNWHLK